MASNVPKVYRKCQQCDRSHVKPETATSYPGVVMLDPESGMYLCNSCWAASPPGERHGPDRPNNRIR